ncbi:substrate-binding periplasmic protein [Aliiglaciecola lipolytica]|uniref:Solute-binding protein family 3/N-terminal domain-containing protein n=1 Tax=Aliiglaciecola lipolytica E3 TaxID=1127673 RepID=K6YN55_9ALTE|nr:ABC transporter substrate-binding protein [Aliiglaciecola lipolytica]GAC12770.1 hypothetical protein GLIP_0115 [Aliiglaciecola lipolytica E3]
MDTSILAKFRVLKYIICFFVLFSNIAAAQQESETLRNYVALTTGDNYYPFVDPKALDNGWSVAIMKAVFQQMEKELNIDVLPWQRGYKWAYEGRYEGTFPYVFTNERAQRFLYSNPINSVPVRVYTAKHKHITSMEQLTKGRLCLPRGYSLSSELESVIKEYQLIIQTAADAGGCVLQVEKGWSDLGFINGYMKSENVNRLFTSMDKVNVLEIPIANIPLYYIVSRKNIDAQLHIERFNQALDAIIASGEKQKIDQRFTQFFEQSEK